MPALSSKGQRVHVGSASRWRPVAQPHLAYIAQPFTSGPLCPTSSPPATGLLYVWVVLVGAKWLLLGRATPDQCRRTDRWWDFRTHLWKGLLDSQAATTYYSFVCSELMVQW